ncbi:hypothetical protein ACWZJV_20915 [Nocardioides sp. WG-D5]
MTANTGAAAAAFYAARERRTVEYGADLDRLALPVTVSIPTECAATAEGQLATLALVDLVTRVHRNVRLDIPPAPLTDQTRGTNLQAAAVELATAIDPFQTWGRVIEDGELVVRVEGPDAVLATPVDVAIRWNGGRGEVILAGLPPESSAGSDTTSVDRSTAGTGSAADMLGAATAACLGAAALFQLAHGTSPRPAALNLFTRTEGSSAGPESDTGPVDVGDVHLVGAGAVGHALTYWLSWFGAEGTWTLIDRDYSALHNTNRCMGMTAADAGWPAGIPGGHVAKKATTAARSLRCEHRTAHAWYDEVANTLPRPDLTLVLANERQVREIVSQRGTELLLHATTGRDWTSELHRHIADTDDCPACRLSSTPIQELACSVGPANPASTGSADAALPFLSALAGLALAAALLDLTAEGHILKTRDNHWRVALDLPRGDIVQSAKHPNRGCVHTLSASVRQAIHAAHPSRWDDLPTRP